jgi:hypothetical protein
VSAFKAMQKTYDARLDACRFAPKPGRYLVVGPLNPTKSHLFGSTLPVLRLSGE